VGVGDGVRGPGRRRGKSEPKLQGTWKLVALQRGDQKAPDDLIQNSTAR